MPDHQLSKPAPLTAEAGQPTAGTPASPPLRISSPAKLLGLVPILLGFHPENCAVILGAESSGGATKVVLHYPLYDMDGPDAVASHVQHALTLLTERHYPTAVAIGYGSSERVTPFIRLLRDEAEPRGIALLELLRAEHSRYRSYVCADPACCPPEGTPYDATPDPALAALLAKGVPDVLASREALVSLVAHCNGREAESMLRAINAAEGRAARLRQRGRQSADPVTRRHPIAIAGINATRIILEAYRHGNGIAHGQAGWLLVALQDAWVRGDALGRMDPAHRDAHLALWTDLTRLALPGYAAPPATLLAFVAWQSGNGSLANVALDRALGDEPGYELAQALNRLINRGVPSTEARPPMTPRQVASRYRDASKSPGPAKAAAQEEAPPRTKRTRGAD